MSEVVGMNLGYYDHLVDEYAGRTAQENKGELIGTFVLTFQTDRKTVQ